MTDFGGAPTSVFPEDAFQHLLTRETGRAWRYQDFFSLCLAAERGGNRVVYASELDRRGGSGAAEGAGS